MLLLLFLYVLAIITFELMYCNAANIRELIQGQEIQYNFSLCRIVMYILFFICYFVFKNRFIEEATKVNENNIKEY